MTEDRDRDEMQKLLAYANFSKVAEAVGVKRAAVANWAAGRHVTPARLEQVRALYRLPVTSQDTTKEPPPEWARAVAEESADAVVRRLVPPELLGAAHRLLADLARLEPPSDEAVDAEREVQDQAG